MNKGPSLYTEDSLNYLKYLEYTLGSLSIAGCLFVVVMFFCYKNLRSFPFESVVYLNLSSMMTSLSYLIYFVDDPGNVDIDYCRVQAFIMLAFENSQYLWTTMIGYSVYQSVINYEENHAKTTNLKRAKYLILCYGLPLLFSLTADRRKVFGPSSYWCWIDTSEKNANQEKTAFSVFFYLFFWLLIFINLIFVLFNH